jgi:Protein of unknown function (DUF1572)
MSKLARTISVALVSEYNVRAAELHKWVDPLSDEQFWTDPFSHGNSAGNLILHLSGNLKYYLGTQVAETGYVRNRDLEFSEDRKPPKKEVLQEFDKTIAMVVATIENQSEEDWSRSYTAEREPEAKDRFTIFLRCAAHLYHHIGQIIYLNRELLK